MTDSFSAKISSIQDAEKIKKHLERIQLAQNNNPELSSAISAAVAEFNSFFQNYGKPQFKGNKFLRNDTPKSELYNENLETLDEDLEGLYKILDSVSANLVNAYNYSTIVTNEITNAANIAASKVLDLNIINNFNKGAIIIAGDDFTNSDKVDFTVGAETTQAELLEGASAISLKRTSLTRITGPNTKVSITPVAPIGPNGRVNTQPTPFNLERFYEGKFYAHIGEQQPEGDRLNLQYILNPATIPTNITVDKNSNATINTAPTLEDAQAATNNLGFFAVIESSEEDKQKVRQKMFDGNPDTYWQAEFVYEVESLLDPFENLTQEISDTSDNTENISESAYITVDVKAAEDLAKLHDFFGRDLIIHLDVLFDNINPVNFVLINPVLFGTSAFTTIVDVATAGPNEEFTTVDGFDEQSFDKILTPEANKMISEASAGKILAPSQFSYKGLGVFSFPVRLADKVRISILMDSPVPNIYERLHVLAQETITTKTTIKTSKKGLF